MNKFFRKSLKSPNFLFSGITGDVNCQALQWSVTIILKAQNLLCRLRDFQDTFEPLQAVIIRIRIVGPPQLLPQIIRQELEKFAHNLPTLV